MNTLNLDIVTPNGSVYNRDNVELVVMQTTAGEHDTYLTSCCLHNNEFNIITIVNRTIRSDNI
jgi:uncharacterized protein YcgI (DUF1989 family)